MSALKPYPEYKDSAAEWLGKVPAHWQVCGLKFVGKTVAGSGFPHEYQGVEGEKYPFLKVNALGRADELGVINSREDSISESVAKKLRASVIPAGSVVLAKIGAALLLGRIRTLSEDSCIDNNMLSVQISNKAASRFVFYAMQQIQFDVLVNPGAVPSLSERNFRSFKLAFPPLHEQRAIAAYLDHETAEVDTFIADQEELIELLRERRAATITQAVTKGLDPHVSMKDSGIQWLGKVPEAWVVGAIKHLALRITDGAHISPETEGGVYDFVSTRDVSASGIDFEGALKTSPETYNYMVKTGCQPQVGDVLFSKDGTVGRTVVVRSTNPFVIASSLIIIRPNPAHLNSGFLDYACQSVAIQEQVRSYVKGAGLPRLSISNLSKIVAAFPSLSEQEEITAYLDYETAEIDAAIADAREAIDLSKERRAALISAAVTGKIDVRNHITAELGAA